MKTASQAHASPLPYAGQDLERRANLGRPFVSHAYGHDPGHEYRFNSLGFRGPEFDPEARFRIYAFGESHAFGYFVQAEESWPARFALHFAESRGLGPGELCFQSFADAGACNSSIARAVLGQCAVAPPDLALVHFGEHRRAEVFLDGRPHRIGPWLLEQATADAAPAEEGPLRELYFRQIERGRAYYEFAFGADPRVEEGFSIEREATCLEQTLRDILLVQHFLRARAIHGIATCDRADLLFHDEVRAHPSLGPLLAQVDPSFLDPLRIWDVEGDRADDEEHAGPERHDRFARVQLGRIDAVEALIESRPMEDEGTDSKAEAAAPGDSGATVAEEVRCFYDRLPFNHWQSAEAAAETVRRGSPLAAYPDLERLLDDLGSAPAEAAGGKAIRVADWGCGSGWLSATLALHYGLCTTAIDFSTTALERARKLAAAVGVDGTSGGGRVRFVEADLETLEPEECFDLVVSLGVLHHTSDPRAAFERLALSVRPGGHLYVGLYHAPGRAPFLGHFRRLMITRGKTAAFEEFRRLAGDHLGDEEHLRSWFRDQVLHPRESLHTLKEVAGWLETVDCQLLCTSINRFEAFESAAELFALEEGYGELSKKALADGRFFPGFFTFLARRRLG